MGQIPMSANLPHYVYLHMGDFHNLTLNSCEGPMSATGKEALHQKQEVCHKTLGVQGGS